VVYNLGFENVPYEASQLVNLPVLKLEFGHVDINCASDRPGKMISPERITRNEMNKKCGVKVNFMKENFRNQTFYKNTGKKLIETIYSLNI